MISFPSFLDPSLEVITICMREEKTEIRRDASKPHLALSFLIGIASSSASHRGTLFHCEKL